MQHFVAHPRIVVDALVSLWQRVWERVEETIGVAAQVVPSHCLVESGVGLHGILSQAKEIVGGPVLDGECLVVSVEVDILASEEDLVEVGQFTHFVILVLPVDAGEVLIERDGLRPVALRGVCSWRVEAVHDDLVTLGAVERFHAEVGACVTSEAGEGPGRFDGALSLASVEEHPAMHVAVAVALEGQLHLPLVKDGSEEFGAVAA